MLISVAISTLKLYFLYANTRIGVIGSTTYRRCFKTFFFCFFKQRNGIYSTYKFSGHSIPTSHLNTKYCCNMKISKYLKIHWVNFRRLFCDTSHNYTVDRRTQHSDIKRCATGTQEGGSIRLPEPAREPPECQGCDSAPAQMSPCPWRYLCKLQMCCWSLLLNSGGGEEYSM